MNGRVPACVFAAELRSASVPLRPSAASTHDHWSET